MPIEDLKEINITVAHYVDYGYRNHKELILNGFTDKPESTEELIDILQGIADDKLPLPTDPSQFPPIDAAGTT
jgi:hypothetical protein